MQNSIVPIGVTGVDELLGGGIPAGHAVLISGGPGTGKTIFATQFICGGTTLFQEPGIIVTLEESTTSLLSNFRNFNFPLQELINSGQIVLIDASPTRSENPVASEYIIQAEDPILNRRKFSIESIISLIHSARRKIHAKRLVIDSINNLLLQYDSPFKARHDIVSLIKSAKKCGLTSLLISENYPTHPNGYFGIEPFLVDGVISLSMLRHGNTKIRYLEIMKMRGIQHRMNAALVRITEDGIVAYPNEPVFPEDTREKLW